LAGSDLAPVAAPNPCQSLLQFYSLVFQFLLCDRASASIWFLHHHLSRITRRRLQPGMVVPAEWSA
jgi:hypothetical protein